MTGHGSWVSYSGGAEIVLAVVLAAAAAAVAFAGIRLPLPARLPRPGRAARILMVAAWVLAITALLVSVAVYETQVYRAGLAHTPPADPITPITLIGAAVLFAVIAVAQKARGWRVALGSAVAGAAAAPMIFELPFDLIIMARSLAVFAVWGLFGFSYPSAPGPITLNMLSKLLALGVSLTTPSKAVDVRDESARREQGSRPTAADGRALAAGRTPGTCA